MYLSERAAQLEAAPGQSAVAASPMRHMDPRARLGCAVLLGVAAVLSPSVPLACAWLVVAIGCLLAARVAGYMRACLSLNVFMACVWLTLPLTVVGETFAEWGGFSISYEGLRLAALLTLKANASLAFLLALCGGMTPLSLGAALQGMRAPDALITLFILLSRHLGTLGQSFRLSLHALRLRAQGLSFWQRLYVYACLVASILVQATDEAERVRMAMLCKRGVLRYDLSTHLHWKQNDTLLCCVAVALCLIVYGGEGIRRVAGF